MPKKYGLVYEEHEESADVIMKNNVPFFVEDVDKEIKLLNDDDYNFLLEGDNLHSLKLLEGVYKDKIDVIYVDPPYNTQNKCFCYDDKFIDPNDTYKHSKWLSFMHKRLVIAKELLSDNGVLFISIDENEYAQLKLLCDEIFGEQNYLTTFIRKTKSMTGDNSNGLNIQHEYLHVYVKNKSNVYFTGNKKDVSKYSNPDNDPNGAWISGNPSARSGGPNTYFPIVNPYTHQIDYPPKGRYWAFSEQTMKKYIQSGRIMFKKKIAKNQRGFIFKQYLNNMSKQCLPVSTLSFADNRFMNSVATKELLKMFDKVEFDYPKPVAFIKELIKVVSSKDSIVLDFFAGSGTTGHAVMQLNAEDGGNRKFILCTNNENNICEQITYERLKKVIYGYDNVKGISANLKYCKVEFAPRSDLCGSFKSIKCIKEKT